jgi:hypothetical protein
MSKFKDGRGSGELQQLCRFLFSSEIKGTTNFNIKKSGILKGDV